MILNLQTSQVYCTSCGYVRRDEISELGAKQAQMRTKGTRREVRLVHRGEVLPLARAAFDSGQEALHRGNLTEATRHFSRAAETQPNFVDAHFWMAEVSDDPDAKREHLGTVLSLMPQHLEAVRELMLLDGSLSEAQAARLEQGQEPTVKHATTPITAEVIPTICPTCGGALTLRGRNVTCKFCGYHALRPDVSGGQAQGTPETLVQGLLKRRANAVRWQIGARVFHCTHCGAEHTLHGRIRQQCRFCGSAHVMVTDAHGSFEQPDGVIPFEVEERAAQNAIYGALNGLSERLSSLWNTNRLHSMQLEDIYLPYWIFDCTVDILHTQTTRLAVDGGSTTTVTQDMVDEVAICAVKSPPRSVAHRISRYEWARMVPYDALWLADCPALLYSIDVDQASLDAREIVAEMMRR
jgi:Zn finger protein HypA/HybF involved in hydrogenase expression